MCTKTGSFFIKYKDYILFNKNLIIAGTGAFFAGALAAQLYALHYSNALANSIVALATEYGVYIPVFVFLFYRDNRHKYVDPSTGKRNSKKLRGDIKKLFAAFSVSEIIYSVARTYFHYQLLQGGIEPYQASMVASSIAWAVFILSVNTGIKLVKLFKS